MSGKLLISKKATAILVYSRPFLVFGGMLCAIGVMWNRNPNLYTLGLTLLFISMSFDLVDGWFAARFRPHPTLAHLADRIMDKIVYSIIFPLIAVGMMWRLVSMPSGYSRIELLHTIFVMIVCITVLIRDNFASFMRSFAIRQGQEPEASEFTRLRTIVAAPVSALLYAHAFYVPEGPESPIYLWLSWLGNLPIRGLFFIEIIFFIISFGSIAQYCRKYGTYCLNDLCLDDELLRRRILSVFPNALTVMNAMMGLLAVFFAYQGRIREAYLLLIGAAMFDKLDGAVARKLGLTEPLPDTAAPARSINLGSIMDDLADGVSFCIVPAWIFYITFDGVDDPFIRKLAAGPVALLYVLMGIARLIYFTLDKKPIPGFFKGMPTPAAALMVTAPLIMFSQSVQAAPEWIHFWGIFCCSLMILSSVLMNIYPIHYIHLGRFMSRKPWFARASALLLISVVFTPFLGHVAFLYLFCYLLSPLVTWRVDPKIAAMESLTAEAE
ncbi:CDP-alcohol phosphatidyltransferase [Desulfonema ishimotonii]|uniref:CDP-alcohol phosphatidyltransferase n=1 Tax=Desulfonema ishimotonii TaxID=45657 RepID=A0A401FRF8_9BACT|nr:CDP-alcohol phosphatidyltransferase family protein [Desulfonema ishimotonii]GBC59548.1 CDP-alcohol phosphatidyltransferase [Desulfonema ishimotonii]